MRHYCIEPKGVLATAQSSKAGSTIPVENRPGRSVGIGAGRRDVAQAIQSCEVQGAGLYRSGRGSQVQAGALLRGGASNVEQHRQRRCAQKRDVRHSMTSRAGPRGQVPAEEALQDRRGEQINLSTG